MGDINVHKISSWQEAQKYQPKDEPVYASDELIIKFTDSANFDPDKLESSSPALNNLIKKHKFNKAERVHHKNKKHMNIKDNVGIDRIYRMKVPKNSDIKKIVEELKTDPNVEYAEPNYQVKACVTPNDPSFPLQWGLTKINAPAAWDINTGSSSVVIAVVDTGVDRTHPDLAANIWKNTNEIAGNGVDDDGNGYIDDVYGWNFVSINNNTLDDHMHGTHVSGILGAVGNNNLGISGLNWNVKIMPVKNLAGDGTGNDVWSVNAITYAADNGANIINCSWGGYYYSQALQDAVNYAFSKGCIIIAAAGNDNIEAPLYPASMENVISVGATDQNDQKADFSNFGSFLDIVAPGVGIYSTIPGGLYASEAGTSMATPFVSGLAALIKAKKPTYTQYEIYQNLVTSVDDLGTSGWDTYYGYGRINALKSLQKTNVLISKILSPKFMSIVNGTNIIKGISDGPNFNHYEISWGLGDAPSSWATNGVSLIGGGLFTENNTNLATLDTTQINQNGAFTLRLRSFDSSSNIFEDKILLYKNSFIKPGWPLNITSYGSSETGIPNLFDVNNDGKDELIQSGPGMVLHVLNEHAIDLPGWPYYSGWPGATTICNVNGDKNIEIAFVGDQFPPTVGLRTTSGNKYPGWLASIPGYTANYFIVASDLNNNGKDNLILFNEPSSLYVCDEKGNNLPGWPKSIPVSLSWENASPAVGDVDGDGNKEIVLATDLGDVHLFKKDGTEMPGWPKTGLGSFGSNKSIPVIADIDHDGLPEIIIAYNDTVYVWHYDGNTLPGWPKKIPGANLTTPIALGDIIGDDKLEIIVGSGDIYAFDCHGNIVPGWPVHGISNMYGAIVADVDGDNKNEVMVVNNYPPSFYILKSNGSNYNGWPFIVPHSGSVDAYSTPAVGDIDGDKNIELIFSTSEEIYCFDMPGLFNPANAPWPMHQRDPQHTGCIPTDFDFSNKIIAGKVNDGLVSDIDFQITTNTLSANWYGFIDPEPGINTINQYKYAIGTNSFGTNFIGWTPVGLTNSFTRNGLPLQNGKKYFTTIRAFNNKGQYKDACSDGVTVQVPIEPAPLPTTFAAYSYPNPFSLSKGKAKLHIELPKDGKVNIQIFNMDGYLVKELAHDEQKSAGIYEIEWDGTGNYGKVPTDKVYFCVISSANIDDNKVSRRTVKIMVTQ